MLQMQLRTSYLLHLLMYAYKIKDCLLLHTAYIQLISLTCPDLNVLCLDNNQDFNQSKTKAQTCIGQKDLSSNWTVTCHTNGRINKHRQKIVSGASVKRNTRLE